jgi:peptidoglycan/LPS O-acetylase OafA/YrhL
VRLQSIQVLRGIAAMMIFIFHLVVTLDRYSPADLRQWVSHLPLGVDLFFLIPALSWPIRCGACRGGKTP